MLKNARAKLIECMCDQRLLLATYNRAATKYNRRTRSPLAPWSTAVVTGQVSASSGVRGQMSKQSQRH